VRKINLYLAGKIKSNNKKKKKKTKKVQVEKERRVKKGMQYIGLIGSNKQNAR